MPYKKFEVMPIGTRMEYFLGRKLIVIYRYTSQKEKEKIYKLNSEKKRALESALRKIKQMNGKNLYRTYKQNTRKLKKQGKPVMQNFKQYQQHKLERTLLHIFYIQDLLA